MATQGVAQPSAKKRNFFLRDLFRLCRSISRIFPRDKKPKHERKHIEQRPISHVSNEQPPPAFNFHFQEPKEEQGVNVVLCKVRSYRLDNNTSYVGNKKTSPLSRSCSQNRATPTTATLRSLSFVGRSKSSCNRANSPLRSDHGMPSLLRSTSTIPRSFANPILYSSSSARVAKPQPTEKKLYCTLEELYTGCTRAIKIKRDVITSSGQVSVEEETVEIKVKPGWKGGTQVTFEGKGNEALASVPADLTFVVVEIEHKVFTREGDDLEMTVEISLLEALTGCKLSVTLPDGDNICLKIEDVIPHGYVTVIQGKGMPNLKERGKRRGDLRVRFRTKFPQQLTDDQRAEIKSILQ